MPFGFPLLRRKRQEKKSLSDLDIGMSFFIYGTISHTTRNESAKYNKENRPTILAQVLI